VEGRRSIQLSFLFKWRSLIDLVNIVRQLGDESRRRRVREHVLTARSTQRVHCGHTTIIIHIIHIIVSIQYDDTVQRLALRMGEAKTEAKKVNFNIKILNYKRQ